MYVFSVVSLQVTIKTNLLAELSVVTVLLIFGNVFVRRYGYQCIALLAVVVLAVVLRNFL